jgi:ATP-binding cassette, subfamily F, member 3
MLTIDDASFGYPPPADAPPGTSPTVIVQHVSKSVFAGQRIGILGTNGQGKSTLVKTIARTLPVVDGKVIEGKGLNIGYFAQQELDVLRPLDTPLEHMIRLARDTIANGGAGQFSSREQDLRNFLGTFNFSGDMVKQAVGTMSGGEKARLVLCMIVWQRPNLLLLDEPTNHLDLATREALAMALNEFEGTVMLVSHDRALLRSVCDEFWLVSKGGVGPFDGDLDDYQRYLLEEAKRVRESLKEAGKAVSEPVVKIAEPAPVAAKKHGVRRASSSRSGSRWKNSTRAWPRCSLRGLNSKRVWQGTCLSRTSLWPVNNCSTSTRNWRARRRGGWSCRGRSRNWRPRALRARPISWSPFGLSRSKRFLQGRSP